MGNFYNCKCDCGNNTIVSRDNLMRGNTKSCGCLQKEIVSNSRQLNLIGQRFGSLVVKKMLEEQDIHGNHYCLCNCDCGNEKKVIISKLTTGHTISCGCQKSKGEFKIIQILKNNNINYDYQKIFDNCIFPDTNYHAYFDFFINNEYLIEFDGEQHFKYKENGWNTKEEYEKIVQKDQFKNQWCKDNNIPLIRIPYTHLETLCLEDLLLETTTWRII